MAVACSAVACAADDDDAGTDTNSTYGTTATTVDPVAQTVADWLSERLDAYEDGPPGELACPPAPARGRVTMQVAPRGGDKPSMRYCFALVAAANGVAVRIRNDSRVPLRLGAPLQAALVPALEPGEVQDVLLPGYPQVRAFTLHYAADVQGALYLLADSVLPKPPITTMRNCIDTLTAACLVEGLKAVAPQEVTIRGRTIPVRRVLEVTSTVMTVSSVADRWLRLQGTLQGGDFTFTVA